MIKRKPKSFKGLDTSGPNMVLAPTFGGVRELVNRYGQATAESMVTHPDLDGEDASHDLVRSFLDDLTYADKVERQTLIRDFSVFVKELKESASSQPGEGKPKGQESKPKVSDPSPAGEAEPEPQSTSSS